MAKFGEWTKYADEKPKKGSMVLVTVGDLVIPTVYTTETVGYFEEDNIAWMPMPEPYKEAQS